MKLKKKARRSGSETKKFRSCFSSHQSFAVPEISSTLMLTTRVPQLAAAPQLAGFVEMIIKNDLARRHDLS